MRDAKERTCLSIEPYRQEDGDLRLFKEASGKSFSSDSKTNGRLVGFLSPLGADRVVFEDTRKSLLQKLLKRSGYRRTETFESQKGTKLDWPRWGEKAPDGEGLFGVGNVWNVRPGHSFRMMAVADKVGPVGEMVFTDYGRFARAKANEFGTEGFGRVHAGRPPSKVLSALAVKMLDEGKRYLILGPEYAEFVRPVHPFPLMHMGSSSQKKHGHSCRPATASDLNKLAKLVSEYEDIERSEALASVTRSFNNPAFRFLLPPNEDGFALIRFMDGAQGMVNDLYVTPASQGRGVGDDLTRASIDQLSECCIDIRLNTIYPRARRLYEKYGFKVIYQDFCVALRQTVMVAPTG